MTRERWFDFDGNPVTVEEAEALLLSRRSDPDGRWVIGRTEVAGYQVSTVWLGLDHNLWGEGPPLIFETMIFGTGPLADSCWRYPTRAAALAGHDQACALCRDEVPAT